MTLGIDAWLDDRKRQSFVGSINDRRHTNVVTTFDTVNRFPINKAFIVGWVMELNPQSNLCYVKLLDSAARRQTQEAEDIQQKKSPLYIHGPPDSPCSDHHGRYSTAVTKSVLLDIDLDLTPLSFP